MTDHSANPDVADRPATAEPPVRVLIVAPAPLGDDRIGGIANFIRGFVRHMPDDFEVEIVGTAVGEATGGSKTEWQTIDFVGRPVRFLAVTRSGGPRRTGRLPMKARIVFGMLRHRAQLPTRGRIAQVHAPGMDLGLLRRKGPMIRVVHNAPEDLASHGAESAWRRAGWSLHLVERFTFARASLVYFVNSATYEAYSERVGNGADKLRYLPNFVDTVLFRPRTIVERSALRASFAAEHGLPADAPWIIFAGRLDPQKDPLLALRAFAAVEAKAGSSDGVTRPHLLIAGEGTLRADCESTARDLGIADRVAFMGTLAQVHLARLMAAADAFLLTSAFEAGPTVVYEALAAGLPVVSTRVGEVGRLVRDRQTGVISDADAGQLAEGIRWALGQDRDAVAQECAESMRPYHLESVLEPFYEEHRRLAQAARRT